MINNVNGRQALAKRMDHAYLEITPAKGIEERLASIPRHSYVAITCSPSHGLEPTLDLMDSIKTLPTEHGLKLIPHVAARMVRDQGHLREALNRIEEAQVESVFVPGGDAAEPVGKFNCAMDLLRAMAEIGHDIEDVGIAAHPEGNPLVSDEEHLILLKEKQEFATYLVTQMCFDSGVLIDWLKGIRRAGVTLPAWIGLPGVADMGKLIKLALRLGVGQSAQMLIRQKGLLTKLASVKPYRPDELLDGLEPFLDSPGIDIPGFHLFSFNDIERTERWRAETYEKLNSEQHAPG